MAQQSNYTMNSAQVGHFVRLPTELVQEIAQYLDLTSIKALRTTCGFASRATDYNFIDFPRSLRITGSYDGLTRALEETSVISEAYRSVSFVQPGSTDINYDRNRHTVEARVRLPTLNDILAVLAALPQVFSVSILDKTLNCIRKPATVLSLDDSIQHHWRLGHGRLYLPEGWTERSFAPVVLRALAISPRARLTSFSVDGSCVSVPALLAALIAHGRSLTCITLRSLILTLGTLLELIQGIKNAGIPSLDRLVLELISPAPAPAEPKPDSIPSSRTKISNATRETRKVDYFQIIPAATLLNYNVASFDWEQPATEDGAPRQAYRLEGHFANMEGLRGVKMGLVRILGAWT